MLHNSHISILWLQNDQALDTLRYLLLTWQYSIGFIQLDKVLGVHRKAEISQKDLLGNAAFVVELVMGRIAQFMFRVHWADPLKYKPNLASIFFFFFLFYELFFSF